METLFISERCNKLLAELPDYICDYILYKQEYVKEYTLYKYLIDLTDFVSFFHSPALKDILAYSTEDIASFKAHMRECGLSSVYIDRKLSCLSGFYKYAVFSGLTDKNPVSGDLKTYSKKYKPAELNEYAVDRLLSGIQRNDMYLCRYPSDGSSNVLPIEERVRIKRSVFITRNYALILLALNTGLTVTEIAALNMDDVDLESAKILVRGKVKRTILISSEVVSALDTYLHTKIPDSFYEKYGQLYFDMLSWCRDHIYTKDVSKSAKITFKGDSDEFYSDLNGLMSALRGCGRNAVKIHMGETALFLSKDGKRMSVRMIEHMVKEMVLTYLPDEPFKDNISVRTLRSMFSKKLLSEGTDDLDTAAYILGYKSDKMLTKLSSP